MMHSPSSNSQCLCNSNAPVSPKGNGVEPHTSEPWSTNWSKRLRKGLMAASASIIPGKSLYSFGEQGLSITASKFVPPQIAGTCFNHSLCLSTLSPYPSDATYCVGVPSRSGRGVGRHQMLKLRHLHPQPAIAIKN